MFASNCCNIVITTSENIACENPPVNNVTIPVTPTPIIAPKNGIKFEIPIKNPKAIAYLTFIIERAILTITATINPSNICVVTNLKNI